MKQWDELTKAEQLYSHWSDYHKEFYGVRPRGVTSEQLNDEKYLQDQINKIDDEFALLKGTFAGREHLRENGWIIEETEPHLIEKAALLAVERERLYNEWMAKWEIV